MVQLVRALAPVMAVWLGAMVVTVAGMQAWGWWRRG